MSHSSHLNTFLSLEWVCIWLFKVSLFLNQFPHWSQGNGFSSVWIFLCEFKRRVVGKNLWQISHSKGFSPVCTLRWSTRWEFEWKLNGQRSHLYALSPLLWIFKCVERSPMDLKAFPHWSHLNGFSPVWILLCLTSEGLLARNLWHRSHS